MTAIDGISSTPTKKAQASEDPRTAKRRWPAYTSPAHTTATANKHRPR